jgi:hypothetical protein
MTRLSIQGAQSRLLDQEMLVTVPYLPTLLLMRTQNRLLLLRAAGTYGLQWAVACFKIARRIPYLSKGGLRFQRRN